ncbi:MAG: hypothetical protein LBV13_05600 [Methanomassiliicoccaceae archaeon]|jgi:KEOPS complex subunit Cgi121|nr:hypothetical protein [Methanomassiliicoccaceae archaeon]
MADVTVIGMRCRLPFNEMIEHFRGLGGDVILMDPAYVCGRDHILSAVMHAERAFANGTNRSKTLLTETILYAAGERQISRALEKMRPKNMTDGVAAAVFDVADLRLEMIGAVVDDDILTGTREKAENLGLDMPGNISAEDLALEMVATVDIQKQ